MRLLYIEDVPMNAKVLKLFVHHLWAHELDIAETAEKGLEMMAAAPYDLVFMDINLPGMDGIEATKRLRDTYTKDALPIIMVSADATSETRKLALEQGANDYITKPLHQDALKAVVDPYFSAHLAPT